jgi:hypothetical protein
MSNLAPMLNLLFAAVQTCTERACWRVGWIYRKFLKTLKLEACVGKKNVLVLSWCKGARQLTH